MDVQADLKAYYEEEARQRSRHELTGIRVEVRKEFIALMQSEQRSSVIDFGSGPGRDAAAFLDAGRRYVGVDLAVGNAALAAERGFEVVSGSLTAPPFEAHSFDAGWSMSTMMHLPDSDVPGALQQMVTVLRPGAPFLIGLWGGEVGDHVDDQRQPGHRRLFSLRSNERNRELFVGGAPIEREQVMDLGPDGWNYQVFLLRTPSSHRA